MLDNKNRVTKIVLLSIMVVLTIIVATAYYLQTKQGSIGAFFPSLNIFRKEAALYPIEVDGKYGYIDKSGKVIVKPKFDEAKGFSDGLAPVSLDNKWGYINKNGIFVIKPQFDISNDFSDGLALVSKNGTDEYVYIDKLGKVVLRLPNLYFYYSGFHDGLALGFVSKKNGGQKSVFIDKRGRTVLDLDKIGYSNSQGEGIFSYFSEGLLGVFDLKLFNTTNQEKWGFISKKGELVVKPQFDYVYNFSEGLAVVNKGSKYGYVNHNGKLSIPLKFDEAKDFSEGLAAISVDGKGGYINPNGSYVIKPQFNEVYNFSNGLAVVGVNSKLVYINHKGQMILKPKYDFICPFKGDLAMVENSKVRGMEIDNTQGYINKRGKLVWYGSKKLECSNDLQ